METNNIDNAIPKKIAKKAEVTLSRLLAYIPTSFATLKSLKILVIGAGFFPSFSPLCSILSRQCPALRNIEFVLIEPQKSETDKFNAYFQKLKQHPNAMNVTVSIHNDDIKKYLQKKNRPVFDIIYFEQPNLAILGILQAKTGNSNAILSAYLRESIPYLKYVVRENSIVLATFISTHDLKHFNSLLRHSLNIKPRFSCKPNLFSDNNFYSSGQIYILEEAKLPNRQAEKLAESIANSDTYFFLFLLISILIFILTLDWAKLLSFFFTLVLLFNHQYGSKGLFIKIVIVTLQFMILLSAVFLKKYA